MRVRTVVLAAWTVGAASGVAGQSGPAPQPTSVEGAASHIYKTVGNVELRLHVFAPNGHTAASSAPAIVFFFGGGWTQGTVLQFVPQAQHLANRGMVAIVADYRVAGRHQTTPFEAIADAKSAIRWLRNHSTQTGIDPNRLAAAGGSAGGHIALSAAIFDAFDEPTDNMRTSAKPDALVLFNPAVNTAESDRFGTRGREGSPLHHVAKGLPPTLILHGRADATVPYSDVEQYCAAAEKQGNTCALVGYDEATHGFFNRSAAGGRWFQPTLLEADRFLTRLGFLRAAVSGQSRH